MQVLRAPSQLREVALYRSHPDGAAIPPQLPAIRLPELDADLCQGWTQDGAHTRRERAGCVERRIH